jgi:hypothetical protein
MAFYLIGCLYYVCPSQHMLSVVKFKYSMFLLFQQFAIVVSSNTIKN